MTKMADEDEIDVLGDFSLDNILSKSDSSMFDSSNLVSQNSDLLKCDYTVHPQWFLDRPSTNPAAWYSQAINEDDQQMDYHIGESHISTENSITDESGWTEKEKHLLNRGIEIFGKSNFNLSQFIGSRTPAEVRYFLKNFYIEGEAIIRPISEVVNFDVNVIDEVSSIDYVNLSSSCLVKEDEIPATIEQVIASVSTASPTVNVKAKKIRTVKNNTRILSKKYTTEPKLQTGSGRGRPRKQDVKFKFKAKIKIDNTQDGINLISKRNLKLPGRKGSKSLSSRSETESDRDDSISRPVQMLFTRKDYGVPVCEGEEVIKIQKESCSDSESNIEIDIDDESSNISNKSIKKSGTNNLTNSDRPTSNPNIPSKLCNSTMKRIRRKIRPDLKDLDKITFDKLMSMESPSNAIQLKENEISDVERYLFIKSNVKSTERYLLIRNRVLNLWNNSKPKYLSKTNARLGFEYAGDVNYIGKIHTYLEQVGAINFGSERVHYHRPLLHLSLASAMSRTNDKTATHSLQVTSHLYSPPIISSSSSHQRKRMRKVNLNGDGGYTMTHDENGVVVNTTLINEEQTVGGGKSGLSGRDEIRKQPIKLIYCKPFTTEHPQPFVIKLDLFALILMDLHAHTYLTEVMGLLGGKWRPQKKILEIIRYEPCRNIAASTIHCDMCPITQARAAENFHNDDLEILGWYHSHPTFAPEPSQQDLETQISVQQWIGADKPCIGIILTPYNAVGALIASSYRCLRVNTKLDCYGQLIPYKFKVDLQLKQQTSDSEVITKQQIDNLLESAHDIVNGFIGGVSRTDATGKVCEKRVDFWKPYFQDSNISHLDKFLHSLKSRIERCVDLTELQCHRIIEGLATICTKPLPETEVDRYIRTIEDRIIEISTIQSKIKAAEKEYKEALKGKEEDLTSYTEKIKMLNRELSEPSDKFSEILNEYKIKGFLNAQNFQGRTLGHVFAACGSFSALRNLVESGLLNPNVTDKQGRSPKDVANANPHNISRRYMKNTQNYLNDPSTYIEYNSTCSTPTD